MSPQKNKNTHTGLNLKFGERSEMIIFRSLSATFETSLESSKKLAEA